MRRLLKYAVAAMVLACPQILSAGGFFGHLSTAESVPHGSIDLGANVGLFEDANALFGHFRIGVIEYCDWEVKVGVLDTEEASDPHLMVGTAFKHHFYDRLDDAIPDLAWNLIVEYYDFDHGSTLFLGGGFIGSYPIKLSNNADLSPYGRLCLRAERNEWEVYTNRGTVMEKDDWDFDIGLNLGAQYAPSSRIQVYGEFQFDDQVGFITGVNFAVY